MVFALSACKKEETASVANSNPQQETRAPSSDCTKKDPPELAPPTKAEPADVDLLAPPKGGCKLEKH